MDRSDNARGIAFMAVAMFAFTVNDAMMKLIAQSLPMAQAVVLRGALTVCLLVMLARATGQLHLALPRADRGLLAWRTLAEVAATLTFLAALVHMPLANLSAILQSVPLAVTLAAALVLREPVGWRRMSAIAVGFVGVLLIVRPGTEGFDIWSLVGVLSVLCVVARDLATRRMSQALSSVVVAIYTAAAVMVLGLAGMAIQGGWRPVDPVNLGRLCVAAVAIVFGYLFIVKAMRGGDVAIVAPFRYTSLLWAILLGWVFWGVLPDALTWTGASLVVASGLFTLWRESRLRRSHD